MRGWLARLRHFLAESIDEWRHSFGVNVLATLTVGAVIFVAGLVLLVVSNVEGHLGRLGAEARVAVYLRDEADPTARAELKRALVETPGVLRVEYVDRAQALERFRRSHGDLAGLAAELRENPLPASLEAVLSTGPAAAETARAISRVVAGREVVEEVRFDRDWFDRLEALVAMAKRAGLVAGVVLLAAVVVVTGSVLRLAVLAHREEVEIMLLVGASPAFVRAPFLVAGVVQGGVAAAFALAGVEVARRLALGTASGLSGFFLRLVAEAPLPLAWAGILAATGVVVGLLSAFSAVRRIG